MHDISLIDPALKNYHNETMLSIQLRLDGFSFAIYSLKDQQLRAFRHYPFTNIVLQEDLLNAASHVLHQDDLLRLPQQKVKAIFAHNKSTLLPSSFVQPENLKQILEFNQPIDELDEIHTNELLEYSTHLVFTLPTYYGSLLTEKFNGTRFYNQATPLLTRLKEQRSDNGQAAITIQLNRDFFDLMVVDQGSLRLYNTYLYKDVNDLLYFILYVCKQLDIDSKLARFALCGHSSRDSRLQLELLRFLPRLEILNAEARCASHKMDKLDKSRFYSLLNLIHCA